MSYRPLRRLNGETASALADLRCLKDLTNDFCRTVREIPSRRVTRQELMRDLNVSKSGIRLLERMGWLVPMSVSGQKRLTYDLQEALLTVVLFQGLAGAPRVRIKRKDSNVTTVARETVNRVVRKETRAMRTECVVADKRGINGDGSGGEKHDPVALTTTVAI